MLGRQAGPSLLLRLSTFDRIFCLGLRDITLGQPQHGEYRLSTSATIEQTDELAQTQRHERAGRPFVRRAAPQRRQQASPQKGRAAGKASGWSPWNRRAQQQEQQQQQPLERIGEHVQRQAQQQPKQQQNEQGGQREQQHQTEGKDAQLRYPLQAALHRHAAQPTWQQAAASVNQRPIVQPPLLAWPQGPVHVSRSLVLAWRNCQELWSFVEEAPVSRLTFRALSGVMDRCSRLFMQQRAQRAGGGEVAACRQLLDAAARELPRLDGWGLTSFIRLAAAVKYLPPEHLAVWQACMLPRVGELTAQGVSNCLLSLGTLLTDDAPPPALAGAAAGTAAEAAARPAGRPRRVGGQLGRSADVAAVASAAAKVLSSIAAREAGGPGAASGGSGSSGDGSALPLPGSQPQVQKSLRDPSVYQLVGAMVDQALQLLPTLKPQGLANTMYGIATLGWPLTEQETEQMLAQVELQVGDFNHLEASQLVQAWAKIEDRIEVTRGFTGTHRRPTQRMTAGVGGPDGAEEEGEGEGEEGEEEGSEPAGDILESCLVVEGGSSEWASPSDAATAAAAAACEGEASSSEDEWGSSDEEERAQFALRRCGLPLQPPPQPPPAGEGEEGEGGSAPGGAAQPPFSEAMGVPASTNMFGKLQPADPGVKYISCYPGVAVMDTLVERVYEQRAQMTNQSLSQFVHSLACLRHKPPPHILDGLLEQLEEMLGEDSSGGSVCLSAATAMLGCAKLAVTPRPQFVAACMAAAKRDQRARVREVLTLAWALATLRICDQRGWDFLITIMRSQMPPHARLSAASNTVLFHAYTIAKLSNPPGDIWLPPELADPARAAYLHQRSTRRPRASSFQAAVLWEVRSLGYEAKLEQPIGHGLIWVDIVVPELNLVVETDGPWHYTRNTEEYTGGTLCRNWLIQRLGWRLVCVGNLLWQHLAEREYSERSYLLRQYFREFHGLVPAEEHRAAQQAACPGLQQAVGAGAQQAARQAAATAAGQQSAGEPGGPAPGETPDSGSWIEPR